MFRIGEFSRLSRVSVKMLRHYDELGILRPAHTDPSTGYRYYSAGQLPRLNRILVLKDLGFTLQQVADLLDRPVTAEQLVGMLTLKQAELQNALADQQARLKLVEAHLAQLGEDTPPYDVVVRPLVAQPVASIRVRTSEPELAGMFETLERFAAVHRIRADAPPLTVYHDADYRETDVDLEAAVPVIRGAPGEGKIRVYPLADVPLAACAVHTGPYRTIDHAGNALLRWVEANGYRIAGPLREVYVRFSVGGFDIPLPPAYLAATADEYVTELQLPVERVQVT